MFIVVQFVFYSGAAFDHMTLLSNFKDPYLYSILLVNLLLTSISIAILFFPSLLYGIVVANNNKPNKYSYSTLSEIEKARILHEWNRYIENKTKPYLNPSLSISEVSAKLETNNQRLSEVINEKTGKSFNEFINCLRVTEAKLILSSDSYKKLTIDAIAKESGFNSKSAFYASFKKFTNMTPKQFISDYNNRRL